MRKFALLSLVVSGTSMAGPGWSQGDGLSPARFERLAGQLGLDAATKHDILARVDEARKESQPIRGRLEGKRKELHAILEQDRPDHGKVMQLIDETGKLRTDLRRIHISLLLEVRQELSPEQRAKFRQALGTMRGQMRERFRDDGPLKGRRRHWRRGDDR